MCPTSAYPSSESASEACPVPCNLTIEIVSPGQTFAEFEEKAKDYLNAGCDSEASKVQADRVWVVEPEKVKLTAFYPPGSLTSGDMSPDKLNPSGELIIFEGDRLIEDDLLPNFFKSVNQIWQEAELS